jgi:hypothetical protein
LKGSSATSAKATGDNPPRTGRSSAKPRPTLTSAEVSLSGPSNPPDPRFHAYRKDLADVALVDCVIASHYAEPVERTLAARATLRDTPSEEADAIRELAAGEPFALLDDSVGWAWGYAGADRRVGYVRSEALKA